MKLKNNLSIDSRMQPYIVSNLYSKHQLGVIRHGLKLGLDVTKYDDPSLPYVEMRKKRRRMYGHVRRREIENRAKANNIDLAKSKIKYKELNFDRHKVNLLLEAESYGFNMKLYEQVKYDYWASHWLCELQQNCIDISKYIDVTTLDENSASELMDIRDMLIPKRYMSDEEEHEWRHY